MRIVAPLEVDACDAETLLGWLEPDTGIRPAMQVRAQIVLLARDGFGPTRIAETLGCSKQTAMTWRDRYRSRGLSGLTDAPRSGRPRTIDPDLVIARTGQPPPPHLGVATWSSRLLAAELAVSNATVAKIWQARGVRPGRPEWEGVG